MIANSELLKNDQYKSSNNLNARLAELEKLIQEIEPGYSMETGSRFTLENGKTILEKVFPHVTVELYQDALWVTEAIPCSIISTRCGKPKKSLRAHRPQKFADHIFERIQRDGGIFIRKNPALFICKFTN